MRAPKELIFELSHEGREGVSLPPSDVPDISLEEIIPAKYLRNEEPGLPEVSEVDLIRHYVGLSRRNHGVDSGFYPLGSCTMKYNPKINEDVARLSGLTDIHPLQPIETVQGCLELLYRMEQYLCEITGMDGVSLQPAAGAHGELTGLMMIKAYHEFRGDSARKQIIVPDSAHGTNPASAALAGFEVVEVKSNAQGWVDVEELGKLVNEKTAGLMLTNPNTLGLFDGNICKISQIIHDAGGLVYYDGANLNAIMGITRPGDMGFDVVHLNLHKTFSTPHGGGGPGSGPVGVKKELMPFLPVPRINKEGDVYTLDQGGAPLSIGKVKSFYGNFGVVVRAMAYILSLGGEGLKEASENAVLNANYLMTKLKEAYDLPYDQTCMHEFVLSGVRQKLNGASTLDMAKKLLDYGIHPPTVYFPLIVKEALMIEPTETESKETLDRFAEIMLEIAKLAEEDPDALHRAPETTVVGRLDEVQAARKPVIRYSLKK